MKKNFLLLFLISISVNSRSQKITGKRHWTLATGSQKLNKRQAKMYSLEKLPWLNHFIHHYKFCAILKYSEPVESFSIESLQTIGGPDLKKTE